MKVISHKPSPALGQIVRNMWMVMEDLGPKVSVKAFPTGYAFINIIQGAEFCIDKDGHKALKTRCYIAGQGASLFNLQMAEIKRAVTIQLQPFAVPALFGIPAWEFFNQQLDLYEVNAELAERLETAINAEKGSEQALHSMDRILCQCSALSLIDPRIQYGLEVILKDKGGLSVKHLHDSLNISQRRGQQIFKHYLGMSAKAFCQVVKMQYHSFELLVGKKLEFSVPEGYYDQSNFIHELKKQTGMLPAEYEQYISAPDKKAAYLSSNLFFNPS